METANEIKGRFSPLEVFSIGQAAHAEGYRELTSYIRDTMMRRVREVVKIENTLQAAREAKEQASAEGEKQG